MMVMSKQGQGRERQGVLGLRVLVVRHRKCVSLSVWLTVALGSHRHMWAAFVTQCECLSVSGVREESFISY